MSTTGQIVGGIVGGIVGFFAGGNVVQGVAIGMSLGGYVDPPPGPDLRGPTLDDTSFQSSAYGVALPRTWGSVAVSGNVIYLENNEYKAVEETEQTGGKGGGGEGTYTSTTYFATFAVSLGEARPGTSPRRIWAGGKLIYSAASGDAQTTVASLNSQYQWRYYDGSQSMPDPRMESVLGVGNAPAYTGTAYIIFYDFELTEFGNGLSGAPIKVEVSEGEFVSSFSASVVDNDKPVGEVAARRKYLMGFSGLSIHAHVPADVITSSDYPWFYRYTYRLEPRSDGTGFSGISYQQTARSEKPGGGDGFDYGSRPVRVVASGGPHAGLWLTDGSGSGELSSYRISIDGNEHALPSEWQSPLDPDTYAFIRGDGVWYFLAFGEDATSDEGVGDGYIINLDNGNSRNIPSTEVYVGGGYVAHPTNVGETVEIQMYDDHTLLLDHTVEIETRAAQWMRSNIFTLSNGDLAIIGLDSPSGATDVRVLNLTQEVEEYSFTLDVAFNPWAGWVNRGVGGGVYLSLCQYFADSVQFIVPLREQEPTKAMLPDVVGSILDRSGVDSYNLDALEDVEVRGYRAAGPSAARGLLGPLQIAYRFDLLEQGYDLVAAVRGASPIATVDQSELNARPAGSSPGTLVETSRETDSRLPSRYTLRYLDYNREYDTNAQYADHPGRARNERTEDVPIVMTAAQAAQSADVLINLSWMERTTYNLQLPQRFFDAGGRKALPGDVFDVEVAEGVTLPLRLATISYTDDQRLEASARLAEPTAYTSSAEGQEAEPPSETIGYAGRLDYALLDIPMTSGAFDSPGYGITAWAPGAWSGAVALASSDEGDSYDRIAAFDGSGTVARAVNRLPSGRDYYVVDHDNTLRCLTLAGDFESVTLAQMLVGKNLCAYGKDGRWELLRFQNADINSDGELEITGILGGLYGTEWAGELHEDADLLILLDDPDVVPVNASLETIGTDLQIKVGRPGDDQQDLDATDFTYEGVNLMPLSGVYPSATREGNDWTISWIPRTRYEGSLWTTGAEPPDDTPRAYEVLIMNGSTVVRTIESDAAEVEYTESQQIEDWGSAQSSIDVEIYQISDRVGRGYVLEASFTD